MKAKSNRRETRTGTERKAASCGAAVPAAPAGGTPAPQTSRALRNVPVVILAGGLGTRLRDVLPDRPKGLATIGSQPFLEIQLELLYEQGARQFVFCIGHFGDMIQEYFGDGRRWDVKIDYSVEGDRLLGTGGALKRAERFFAPRALVLNGDTFFAVDYNGLVQRHLEERRYADVLATLALAHAPDNARYGHVLLDHSGRHLQGFAEKPAGGNGGGGWLSAGAYVIERGLLDGLSADQPCSLERDVFPNALAAGRRLAALSSSQLFFDIGTPGGLQAFAEHYAELRHDRYQIADPVGS
jgi:NDP-sugar pyrophosphorylase family protein